MQGTELRIPNAGKFLESGGSEELGLRGVGGREKMSLANLILNVQED